MDYALPMLMLPFGNDQKSNAAKERREGFGLKLDWHDVDEQKITSALSRLLSDSRLQNQQTHRNDKP